MGLSYVFPLYNLRLVPYDCNDLTIQRWQHAVCGAAVGRREAARQ